MVSDLEQALGIEAARAGGVTNGQATTVLSALPPGATGGFEHRRRRWPVWVFGALVFVAVCVAAFLVFGRGGSSDTTAQKPAPPPLRAAHVIGAKDFDPLGGGSEHPYDVNKVFDSNDATFWSTETYQGGDLNKAGVGIYVWTQAPIKARRLDVTTTTSGFTGRIYGSNSIPTDLAGWGEPLGRLKGSGELMRATLPGRAYSHYLVWITKLPPAQDKVDISTIKALY
jgi:eukaryotic-like serine/threonine-protein kinase